MNIMKEFLIKDKDEFIKSFDEIKANKTDEDVVEVKVKFDESLDTETISKALESVLETEESVFKYATGDQEFEQLYFFDIDLKNLSKDVKLELFKVLLKRETTINTKVILNIYNLIKTYNSFEDAFFAHPDIYFNTLEEYLDIRTDLMDELKEFSRRLIIYYLSCLKSLHVTEADTAYNNLKPIPAVYQRILLVIDFFTLSKIMNKVENINTSDLIYVQNSTKYIDCLSTKQVICKDIADHIQ